jgi:hypothetical protein
VNREEELMAQEYRCGPETDSDFFNELRAVFDKYPDAAQNYSIQCRILEKDVMHIDLEKQLGISRVEGDQIITTFREFDDDGSGPCCEWVYTGASGTGWECVRLCEL